MGLRPRLTIGRIACEVSRTSYDFKMRQGEDMPGGTERSAAEDASTTPTTASGKASARLNMFCEEPADLIRRRS
jgi:hypothetical protein